MLSQQTAQRIEHQDNSGNPSNHRAFAIGEAERRLTFVGAIRVLVGHGYRLAASLSLFALASGIAAGQNAFPPSSGASSCSITAANWLTCSFAAGVLTIGSATGQTSHQVIGTGTGSTFGPINITLGDLPALPSANIWVGGASNAPAPVTISGDSTMNDAGVTTVVGINGTSMAALGAGNLKQNSSGTPSVNLISVTVPAAQDVLCAHGGDSSIGGVTCGNSADDTSVTAFATTVAIQAGFWASGKALRVIAQFGAWTPAAASVVSSFRFQAGATVLYAAKNNISLANNLSNTGGSASWLIVGTGSSGNYTTQPLNISLSGATASVSTNNTPQPVTVGTGTFSLGVLMAWAANGVGGTITYASGASACTNGTQTVTFTNGAGTGATGTITVSGNVPTGAVTITNTGFGYTALPTQGTVANCTGTPTFTGGTLAGAQGHAIQLQSLVVEQVN